MKSRTIMIAVILFITIVTLIIFVFFKKHFVNKNVIEIVKETNGGVPFEWRYELSNSNVKMVKQYTKTKSKYKNMAGAPVDVHFVFNGMKEGQTKVTLKYVNFTNEQEDVSSKSTYIITVDKDLNCTLKEE